MKKHDPMSGLYQRGEIWWFQPPMLNGVRHKPITLQTDDLTEALARKATALATPVLAETSDLESEAKAHIEWKLKHREYTPPTAAAKLGVLKAFFDTLPNEARAELVTSDQIKDYYLHSRATQSDGTAHKRLMTIRAFFGWLVERKKIRRNPAVVVPYVKPESTSRIAYCTTELRDKLINECPRQDLKLILMLGFHAGFRKNEIIEAVPWWFDLERGVIDMRSTPNKRFTKQKRAGQLPMRIVLREFLKKHGLTAPYLLHPEVEKGKNLYRYDFAKPFRDYMHEKGCDWVTPHVMRHTFASLMVMDNTSIYKVAEWMRDTVAVVQLHYGHLSPVDQDIEEGKSPAANRSTQRSN